MDSVSKKDDQCPYCGGRFVSNVGGATHPYMLSSSGCWAAYGEILAREYRDRKLFDRVHRLTVDTYAIQHPGEPDDRRARQSVWIHATSLWLVLRKEFDMRSATAALARLTRAEFPQLPSSPARWPLTVADIQLGHVADHIELVERWARECFDAWPALHGPVEEMSCTIIE